MKNLKLLFLMFVMLVACSLHLFAQADYQNEVKGYASQLFNSFNENQRKAGHLTFNDTSRLKWNNLPVGLRARAGVSVAKMNNDQRRLLHRVLSAALSSQGYLKASGIMHLDELVNAHYDSLHSNKQINDGVYSFVQKLQWSPGNYYFAFFGSPTQSNWGFKLEGHHLSVNFTFINSQLSVTPFFIGTDPAEMTYSFYAGWRVLGEEEDLGLKLIKTLSEQQRAKAISSKEVPADIITSAESGKRLVDNWGIKASDFNALQKSLLQQMIREFVFNLEYDKAMAEYDKIQKAGLDNIYFGWIGGTEEKQAHYYVINGPTFLIEFDNNGGPRNEANHIHAIWREKGNEYGEDVLKAHYKNEKH